MKTALAILVMCAGAALGTGELPPPPPSGQSALAATGEIGRLIEAAGPGATVRVPAGTYREHLRITSRVNDFATFGNQTNHRGAFDSFRISAKLGEDLLEALNVNLRLF